MGFVLTNYADMVEAMGRQNVASRMTDEQFIISEIKKFRLSKRYNDMINGDKYYHGNHDILNKKRTAIGDKGELIELENLPNNRIVDNQYKKMVDQKSNYLVGQPFLLKSDDQAFVDAMKPYIQTKRFFKILKNVAKDSLNCGIGWIMPTYDDSGKLILKRVKPFELIPIWSDADHTILESAIRIYQVVGYEGTTEKVYDKVEVFNPEGVYYYTMENSNLIPEEPYFQPYFTVIDDEGNATGYHWDKIPLVAYKYNDDEIPLIAMCKGLVDGLDKIESQWEDQMEEDPRNTIMVLVNYDGENLGEFRRNLATYGAVKVRSCDGANGDVKTLQIEVNSENYKAIIEQFKKAIIENCMGYDAKDERLGGNPNEMNLKSMYSDIDLDTNGMETEYQAAFEELIWFLQCHVANVGEGDFEDVEYDIIFNRDIMISESSVINDVKNSMGILSEETLVSQHPWVDDVNAEMERIKKQKEENMNLYGDFGNGNTNQGEETKGDEDDESGE